MGIGRAPMPKMLLTILPAIDHDSCPADLVLMLVLNLYNPLFAWFGPGRRDINENACLGIDPSCIDHVQPVVR